MSKINNLIPIAILIAIVFQSQLAKAQSPEKMSYQAIVRDANSDLIINQSVGMRISILQGSANGTSIYSETQNQSTNANGLVSIEIGSGTTSDNFSTIDWVNGPYFIKTETDPEGGTNYIITGTSQLMSVPYALHAKTAGSVTGDISESDPIFKKSFAFGINEKDTAKWNDHTQINSKSIAKLGFAIGAHRDSTNIANMGFVAGSGSSTYSVGDFALGGIVFWVDESGQHGLVCTKENQTKFIRWHAGTNGNTRAYGDGPYSGEMNTSIIIAAHVAIGDDGNNYAARMCADLQITEGGKTYGDWYLPAIEELKLIFANRAAVESAAAANGGELFRRSYWSSTESDAGNAMQMSALSGNVFESIKTNVISIRAVRAF